MSAAAEWPAEDTHNVSLPTIVSSTDLFDGELFGDELIDIYNSTVEQGHNQDIPSLLAPVVAEANKEDVEHGMLPAIGDGFGAFRPSTSFNDLTTLLSPTPEAVDSTTIAPLAAPSDPKTIGKKRSGSADVSPDAKRKVTAAGRRVSIVKTEPTATKKTEPIAKVPIANVKVKTEMIAKPVIPPSAIATAQAAAVAAAKSVAQPAVSMAVAAAATAAASNTVTKPIDPSDFKTIAQAAVSSLILSAGNGESAAPPSNASKEKVDTSTAHIKALTGNNWVAACAGATHGVVPVASSVVDPKNGNNRARRQNLTPDERARQNRDRNREHARNTRLRKKAYVEELKRTLTELVSQRDAAELEKRQAAQRELEQREVRFRVIEEFLKLRGRNETNFARWAAILEDGFSLDLPSTDFCKLALGSSVPGQKQVLNGVSDVMADAGILQTFLQTLGGNTAGVVVSCQYQCDRKNFFMDGCQAVLEWSATSVGAVKKGASSELTFKGIVRGKFSPASNKLLSATMTCDTGAVLLQLQKLSRAEASKDSINFEFAAAQAAANQADAILDSLQVPCVPAAVIVHPSTSSSEGSCDKGGLDSDESDGEQGDTNSKQLPLTA